MTRQREKAKPQNQLNRQLEIEEHPPKEVSKSKSRKEKLSDYLIDISKYVMTGVVIASLFKSLENQSHLYVVGLFVAFTTLAVGIVLTDKNKK